MISASTRSASKLPAPRVAGLAVLAAAVLFVTPVPAGASPPVVQHFTATVSDTNLVTLDWKVNGGDSSNLLYIYDLGFRPQACPSQQPVGCSTSFRVAASRVYSYTLSVKNNASEFITVGTEVSVAKLTPPTVPSGRVHVDMLNIQSQTLTWSHAPAGPIATHFVEITQPGSLFPIGYGGGTSSGTHFPLSGSYTVPASSLKVGSSSWSVRYCVQPAPGQTALCSAGTSVSFVAEPAQIAGPYRRFLPAGQATTLSWSGSGNWWYVSAPSLNIGQWTTTPSITVPAAAMTAGVHDVSVTSCIYGGGCSNRADLRTPVAGTVHQVAPYGSLTYFSPTLATVSPDGGGAPLNITTTRHGTYYHSAGDNTHVSAGAVVGFVLTSDNDTTQLVVGGGPSVATWTNKSLAADFNASVVDTAVRPGTGSGLDITFDTSGGIWEVGEFGTSAARIHNGVLSEVTAPYARTFNPKTGVYDRTKPFVSGFGGGHTSTSALVESVIDTGTAIWYAQGGNYFGAGNHARLIRFDRNGVDNPATPDDERLCAVHVPGENSQLYGLAYDPARNRVWFSEQAAGARPASVSWLTDGDIACNNGLAYQQWTQNTQGTWIESQNTAAIDAAAAANLCAGTVTTHCIHRIALDQPIAPAHLSVDSAGGSLWIVDSFGNDLRRIALSGAGAVEKFPLPTPVRPGFFLGFPWQIRSDGNAVYLNEYGDSQLLRFDKAKSTTTDCHVRAPNGTNPCISEIFLPMAGTHVAAHSIALRNGKLWFTMGNESRATETPNGSYFGYVNVASWAAVAPTGVIYNDLSSLGSPPERDHWSVRGIEVNAAGKVALAEAGRAIVVLTPK